LFVKVDEEGESNRITVNFPQPDGENETQNFTWFLTFDTPDIASKAGNIWEVNTPGIAGNENVAIEISAPSSFGIINYSSSEPSELIEGKERIDLEFTDDLSRESGVMILFGEYDYYSFQYKYELDNTDTIRLRATVTLPPDYKNQRIYFTEIDPLPERTFKDQDGNYIAEYLIDPGEAYDVLVKGFSVVQAMNTSTDIEQDVDLVYYLQADTFWQVDNAEIKSLAGELVAGKENDKEKGKAIYDYVSSELSYSQAALSDPFRGRLGAEQVLLAKDNAICQEYADLFVTLARVAGIPARLVAGYTSSDTGYELPENTLHAWAEFHTEDEGWISVDPTWESTSGGFNFFDNLGTNHLALAIRGVSSVEPFLVLSFVPGDDVSDNLIIQQVEPFEPTPGGITFTPNIGEKVDSGFTNSGTIAITNNSQVVLTDINLEVSNGDYLLELSELESNVAIFPGDTYELQVIYASNDYLKQGKELLEVKMSGLLGTEPVTDAFNLEIEFAIHQYVIYGGIGGGVILFIMLAVMIFRVRGFLNDRRKAKIKVDKFAPTNPV